MRKASHSITLALKSFKVFGLYAELPVAIYPRMDVNYHPGTIPKDIGALFRDSIRACKRFFRRISHAVG